MSKIDIIRLNNKYKDIYILDKYSDNNLENSLYQSLLNILKKYNIITIQYNKLKILLDNICIIYNINDKNEEYKEIKHFIKFYSYKFDKHNIKFILLNKYNNKIYYINNIIICHSKLIKMLFNLTQFNNVFNNIMNNLKHNNLDITLITNEIIRKLIINIINNNKLNNLCFKDLDKEIIKYFTKKSEHLNKLSSTFYLDKTIVIENYKNNNFNKRKFKIKNDNYNIIHITDDFIKLI